MKNEKMKFSSEQREKLLNVLKARFEKNMCRHKELEWSGIQTKLETAAEKLWSLNEMERTGGEPDVVEYNKKTGEYIFFDCSEESPKGRRNVCYDREGQAVREKKGVVPAGNAVEMATAMGIELLTEEQYRKLQHLGNFDMKTSSWIQTPAAIREVGGALFAERRYGNVLFVWQSFWIA